MHKSVEILPRPRCVLCTNTCTADYCPLSRSSSNGNCGTSSSSCSDPRTGFRLLCEPSCGQRQWPSRIVPASGTPRTVGEPAGTPSLLSSMPSHSLWLQGTVSPRGATACAPRRTWCPKEPARHTRDVCRELLVCKALVAPPYLRHKKRA